MPKIRLVIADLDNTLYDWVGFYIPSFLGMLEEISKISGVAATELKRQFKVIHERHGTSEYAFAIEELELRGFEQKSVPERLAIFQPAIERFRATRKRLLRLYPGVAETLASLKASGVILAALTDSTTYYAARRVAQLGIEQYFDVLCAPRDHGIPPGIQSSDVRKYPDDSGAYSVRIPQLLEAGESWRKPDSRLLELVLRHTAVEPSQAVLIGDSKSRDIRLARNAGVWAVHASYGELVPPALMSELLQITYRKDGQVAETDAAPDFSVSCFMQLLSVIKRIEAIQCGAGAADRGSN